MPGTPKPLAAPPRPTSWVRHPLAVAGTLLVLIVLLPVATSTLTPRTNVDPALPPGTPPAPPILSVTPTAFPDGAYEVSLPPSWVITTQVNPPVPFFVAEHAVTGAVPTYPPLDLRSFTIERLDLPDASQELQPQQPLLRTLLSAAQIPLTVAGQPATARSALYRDILAQTVSWRQADVPFRSLAYFSPVSPDLTFSQLSAQLLAYFTPILDTVRPRPA